MKRIYHVLNLFLALMLLAPPAFADNAQSPSKEVNFGFLVPRPDAGTTTFNLNAASATTSTNFFTFCFTLSQTKTLNRVKLPFSAVTGSPTAANASLELQADSLGNPSGTSLETKALGIAPTTVWNEWSGYTTSLTAGTHYCMVLKNLATDAQTNAFTVKYAANTAGGVVPDYGNAGTRQFTWGTPVKTSVNSGGAWTDQTPGGALFRLEFSDGSFFGVPYDTVTADAFDLYGTREGGNKFTVPSTYPTLRVACVSTVLVKGGTPATLRYRLYSGSTSTPTLVATTNGIPVGNITSNEWDTACFSTPQTLLAGTTYRITTGQTAGGSSNYYDNYKVQFDNTAGSLALVAFGGLVDTETTDGTTFTEASANIAHPMNLILDGDLPFSITPPVTNANSGPITVKRTINVGTTSYVDTIPFKNTDGTFVTGKVSSDFTCSYSQDGGAATGITLNGSCSVGGAYASACIKEISAASMPGQYRFDVPNALLAAGHSATLISCKTSTSETTLIDIQLNAGTKIAQLGPTDIADGALTESKFASTGAFTVNSSSSTWNLTMSSTDSIRGQCVCHVPSRQCRRCEGYSYSAGVGTCTVDPANGTVTPANLDGYIIGGRCADPPAARRE